MSTLTTHKPLARASLADLVYHRLLDSILAGTLPSGAALIIADIAKELEVSPSPVREAILRLEAEGLVSSPTNRRATVVSFVDRDIIQFFYVRELLECGATRLAAVNIDERGLADVRRAAEECAALQDDPAQKKEMVDLDNRFHFKIAEASGNRVLLDEIVRISRRVRVMQWLRLTHASMKRAYAQHLEIIGGLEQHDPEAAALAMATHIRLAAQYVMEGLRGADKA
jgi:DNA-binding GntR family transcriptional regulator